MRKSFLFPLCITALALSGCNLLPNKTTNNPTSGTSTIDGDNGQTSEPSDGVYTPDDENYEWGDPESITGDFSILNSSDEASGFEVDGSTYTIKTAGTYTLQGVLDGRIVVDVEDGKVELDLKGALIRSSENSPIYTGNADTLKIKAIKNTFNAVIDNRENKVDDSDDQHEGAIAAKSDLNFIGTGELIVLGNYNNGIHTSKDLKIKNQHLYSYGYNHAIRGGNSISITNASTYIFAFSKTGDGLKSNDGGLTSKGKQKGTISIEGGTVTINAETDGIDAAYNAVITNGTDDDSGETTIPNVAIYTNIMKPTKVGPGDETNFNKAASTAKGIKAANEVLISGGQTYVKAYDDGLHANEEYLTDSDDVSTGVLGLGNITISGGTTTIDCTDDGLHADNVLTISNGIVNVVNSYEGIEGETINISGGTIRAFGLNDGMNASKDNPSISISGGFLEIGSKSDGNADGIDSNGTYTQTGGIVICKGPNTTVAAALDHDGTASISGGTLIALGSIEGYSSNDGFRPQITSRMGPAGGKFVYSNVSIKSGLSFHSKGSYSITIGGASYTITNEYSYARTICFSDTSVS